MSDSISFFASVYESVFLLFFYFVKRVCMRVGGEGHESGEGKGREGR